MTVLLSLLDVLVPDCLDPSIPLWAYRLLAAGGLLVVLLVAYAFVATYRDLGVVKRLLETGP